MVGSGFSQRTGKLDAIDLRRFSKFNRETISRRQKTFPLFPVNREMSSISAGEVFDFSRLTARLSSVGGESNICGLFICGPDFKFINPKSGFRTKVDVLRITNETNEPGFHRIKFFRGPFSVHRWANPFFLQGESTCRQSTLRKMTFIDWFSIRTVGHFTPGLPIN